MSTVAPFRIGVNVNILEVIYTNTPWEKQPGWEELVNKLADQTKEDPVNIILKLKDWQKTHIGGKPAQAYTDLGGKGTLGTITMKARDLNKQPPDDSGDWIDQGRVWARKTPPYEYAVKPDPLDPTTWGPNYKAPVAPVAPVNKEEPPKPDKNGNCPTGYKLSADKKSCELDGSKPIEKKEVQPNNNTTATCIWPAGNASLVNRDNPWGKAKPKGKHEGIDIGVAYGTPLVAPEDGKIEKAETQKGLAGLYIALLSKDGKRRHVFMHLSKVTAMEGDAVTQGTKIGATGGKAQSKDDLRAGNAKGIHLHWEVTEGGTSIDPETLIKK